MVHAENCYNVFAGQILYYFFFSLVAGNFSVFFLDLHISRSSAGTSILSLDLAEVLKLNSQEVLVSV